MRDDVITGPEALELRQWVDRLRTRERDERARAVKEIARLGVWTRASVRTRGGIGRPGANRLPDPTMIELIVETLRDDDPAIRGQAARALGQWGGAQAAVALASVLESEPNLDVRLYAIHALRTIGGSEAVAALRRVAEAGGEAECDAALSGIEELMTGGGLQDTEPPSAAAPPAPSSAVTRTRGAVRARGSLLRAPRDSEASLVATLERVHADERNSAYLRLRASEVLRLFQ